MYISLTTECDNRANSLCQGKKSLGTVSVMHLKPLLNDPGYNLAKEQFT